MRRLAETPRDVLGFALRDWRVSQGLSQAQLAARCGRGQSYISRCECGEVEFSILAAVRADVPLTALLALAEQISQRDAAPWPGAPE